MAIVRRSTRTVKVAELLGTLPALFATTTANFAPSSAPIVAGVVYVAEVAPATAAPFLLHWYERGAVPVAVTLNVAVAGAATAWFCGWEVVDGAKTGGGDELLPQPPQPPATKTVTQTAAVASMTGSLTCARNA